MTRMGLAMVIACSAAIAAAGYGPSQSAEAAETLRLQADGDFAQSGRSHRCHAGRDRPRATSNKLPAHLLFDTETCAQYDRFLTALSE